MKKPDFLDNLFFNTFIQSMSVCMCVLVHMCSMDGYMYVSVNMWHMPVCLCVCMWHTGVYG